MSEPDTQVASLRLGWEFSTVSGPYAGEVALFGMSLGVQRSGDPWSGDVPSYRGRSGVASDTFHSITGTGYSANVGFLATLDDGAGQIDQVTQAEILDAMYVFGGQIAPILHTSVKFSGMTIAAKQQTGAQSKGNHGSTTNTTRATCTGGGPAGTQTAALPPEVAAAISLYGVGNLRRSRGRFYVGPLSTNWVETDGTLKADLLTSVRGYTKTLLEKFLAMPADGTGGAGGDTFLPWVHNPSGDPLVGNNPPTGSPIASIRTDTRPDSQRRREHKYKPAKTILPIDSW